ncbi:hypothetical protein [Alkalihalobacillus sp. 1P02AB]|uniref:hypothetical protein n=1 Tax=Alkalihalobacillus sp. 1P02AB TaxID=3132260 RepID=UPI0039A757E3
MLDDNTVYEVKAENEIRFIKQLLNGIELTKANLEDIEHTFNEAGNTYLNILHDDTGDVFKDIGTTIFVSEEGDVIIWSEFSSGNEPEIYQSNNQVELYQELNNIKN